jgi:hypothetical protein
VNNNIKSEVKNSLYLIFNPCIPLDCENLKEFVPKQTEKMGESEILVFFENKKLKSFWI